MVGVNEGSFCFLGLSVFLAPPGLEIATGSIHSAAMRAPPALEGRKLLPL